MESRFMHDPTYTEFANEDFEAGRTIDLRDGKWLHPVLFETLPVSDTSGTYILTHPDVSFEEKKARAEELVEIVKTMIPHDEGTSACTTESYMVPGCPEEPDVEVEVVVIRPRDLKKRKARAMFYCMGGALVAREPEMFPIEDLCEKFNCVAIVCKYRRSWEAPYPAAVNDLHAAYQWMVENAKMLQINPDNVVITGTSSGGHLAAALPFRLKQYGFSPKGVVACMPQVDDRSMGTVADYIYGCGWDSPLHDQALKQYMGRNYANGRIGGEALANHATVEDCIGYPPLFLHTVEWDPDRDTCREFYGKVLEAKSYAEFHCWGGAHHNCTQLAGLMFSGEVNEYSARVNTVIAGNIEDCFTYDLRRPWVVEEY